MITGTWRTPNWLGLSQWKSRIRNDLGCKELLASEHSKLSRNSVCMLNCTCGSLKSSCVIKCLMGSILQLSKSVFASGSLHMHYRQKLVQNMHPTTSTQKKIRFKQHGLSLSFHMAAVRRTSSRLKICKFVAPTGTTWGAWHTARCSS